MMTLAHLFLLFMAIVNALGERVVFPTQTEQKDLAARISCNVGESRSFRYSSVTNLWGSVQGQIALNGDVTVYCLGNDDGGTYGAEGLKYLVELSQLRIEERSHRSSSARLTSSSSTREKRGIGDFFKDTWTKIKNFFGRMFGRGGEEKPKSSDGERREIEVSDAEEGKTSHENPAEEEEDENALNYESLYTLPFEFVQLADGSIPEVRFAEEEKDGRVRNFKRHVIDSFATQLQVRPEMTKETSVIGEHLTNYSVTVGSEIPEPLKLGGIYTTLQFNKKQPFGDDHVLVEKVITEDDILNLAGNQKTAALNDRDKMGLKAEQRQIFLSGKLISSSGTSSISLFDTAEKKRSKRSVDDVMSFFQARSEFELKLEKRKRRSVSHEQLQKLQEKSMGYKAASRFAEVEESSAKQKLKDFEKSVGNTAAFMNRLIHDSPIDEQNMQTVFEMVEEEVRLDVDQESHSMAAAIRKTLSEHEMMSMCKKDFNRCRDFLQLLALVGGSNAEQVLLACLSKADLDLLSRQQVADILSEVSRPSDHLLSRLIAHLEDSRLEREVRGALCLSAASIAAQSPQQIHKLKMAEVLVSTLEREKVADCPSNPLVLDLLEAMGNLGHNSTVDYIIKVVPILVDRRIRETEMLSTYDDATNKLLGLQVSSECSSKQEIQIACAHALRRLSSEVKVQQWMLGAITSETCDVIRAILGSLLDAIAFQERERDTENWPRNGFNFIDEFLKSKISLSSENFRCASEDAARYFRKKRDDRAREVVKEFFSEDAEAWNPGSGSRQKRDLWDKLNCKEWTEDNVYRPIQDKQQFESDKATYNRRKSCLASRMLGLRGANAEIYAGMFAGVKEPSDPPEYKLFTKFVSGLNFLGHQMEIGSFYFYHHSGNTKAYVRIMGRTRQEFSHEGCTPTELRYRPITHIPLFLLTVSAVQMSLGVHLSSHLSLDTQCPGTEIYNLKPLTNVRVGGEAIGTVLFIRGALSLGGNFNYYLQFTFNPHPDMCLEGRHGYDPMSINLEAHYQLWNVLKNDWGKHRVWQPNSLNWQVASGRSRSWFNDTCVLKLSPESSSSDSTPSEENDVVLL